MVLSSILSEKRTTIGAVVEKPSMVFNAICGCARSAADGVDVAAGSVAGLVGTKVDDLPGILIEPSALLANSRSTGNGKPSPPAVGSKTAFGASGASATRSGPTESLPPHACKAAAMAVRVRTFFIVRIVFLPMFILYSFLLCAGLTRRPSPCTTYQLPRRRSAAGWK